MVASIPTISRGTQHTLAACRASHAPRLAAGHRRAGALPHRQDAWCTPPARGRIAGRIVETEAYPPGDPTGYARPGLTTSNAPLFAARGTAYVRMVYGTCLHAEPGGRGGGHRAPRC